MHDRRQPLTDYQGTEVPVDASVFTPGPFSRTIDLEATGAFPSAGSEVIGTLPCEIAGYVLQRELGRGAFGIVYFGHHKEQPGTPLAIKFIEDRGNLEQLLVEPALLSRVKHPNVVRLENYLVHDGRLMVAMEYVAGTDLKAMLDSRKTFPADQVLDFLSQIGSALVEAHAQNIVHRDLKPSNVLVELGGKQIRFVLADFGIGRTNEGVQAEKHIGGTFLYMAPEQLRGRPGPQSDLWAIGVIAYQMLTGLLPFPGATPQELSRQIQYTDPPPPSTVTGQALPGRIEEAVLALLRKSISERTASATQLLVQLGIRTESSSAQQIKPRLAERGIPILDRVRRSARRAAIGLVLSIVAFLFLNGLLSGLLTMGGLALFYYAQAYVAHRGGRVILTLAAFVVLAARLLPTSDPEAVAYFAFGMEGLERDFLAIMKDIADYLRIPRTILLAAIALILFVITMLLPVLGSAAYANLRRARRERALLEAALGGHTGSDEYLGMMREMLSTRFEDVGFHLRYAELLYARDDFRNAAIEARLIRLQDPYNFNANLLLANAYFALGLKRDCLKVCDAYLAVTGYCFEFQELRGQCAAGAEE